MSKKLMRFWLTLCERLGFRSALYTKIENWRRKPNCLCRGCRTWAQVEAGEMTVEAAGQHALACRYRTLAWRDYALVHARWNIVPMALALLLLTLTFATPAAVPGVMAIVVTAGKNDILTKYFKGSSYTAAWYVGLVDGGSSPTYAAGDTMGSHAGWTENVGYSNSTRVAWTGGTASGGSIDNSGSVAAFTINATGTIAGSFLTSDSTKSGTSGTLYCESNFSQGNRSVVNGDTLNVTETLAAA